MEYVEPVDGLSQSEPSSASICPLTILGNRAGPKTAEDAVVEIASVDALT
jgi:hypothetical protein